MRIICLLIVLLLYSNGASAAQAYFGASGGWAFGGSFSDYKNTSFGTSDPFDDTTNLEGSDLDATNSAAWGVKAGLSFDGLSWGGRHIDLSWLSFEINYFERSPSVQRQSFTAAGLNPTSMFPALPFNGQIEMELESVKNLVFQVVIRPTDEWIEKYLFNRIEPYVGVGAGMTFTKLGPVRVFDNSGNLVSTNIKDDGGNGLVVPVTVGLNYKITDSVLLYSEYKFSWGSFTFSGLDSPGETEMTYIDHVFMLGLAYRFNFEFDFLKNKESLKEGQKWCQNPDTNEFYACGE